MKRIGIAVLSAASLLAAGTAAAEGQFSNEPQWTYGQIGWLNGDGFDNSGERDGFKADASVGFLRNYHFQLTYEDGTADYGSNGSLDWDGYRATLGYHQAVTDSGNTQLFTNLNYFDLSYDRPDGGEGGDPTVDGYGIGFGVRSMISEHLELETQINFYKGSLDPKGDNFYGDDADYTDTGLTFGGRYHWLPSLSTGVTILVNSDGGGINSGDSATIDIRYSFGSDIF